MTAFARHATPVLLAALLGACAAQPARTPPPADAAPGSATVSPAPAAEPAAATATDAAAAGTPDATDTATAAVPARGDGGDATAGEAAQADQAVDDYSALYGAPAAAGGNGNGVAYDPWEKYNRGMHRFNLGVDRYVAHPLATAYTKVVPGPVRRRVTNFFDNIGSPVTLVNQLLQGRPGDAWVTLGRFLMNSTIGIGGLYDPATHEGLARSDEDFGQTLGVWGWRNSRYFELPFFGPRTLRDTFGMAGDYPLSPMRQIDEDNVRYGLQGLQLVDTRVKLMPLDDLRANAPDEYSLVRDGWMQRRNYQIQHDLQRTREGHDDQNDALPDYLKQDGTVPTNAIPVPATWGR